MELSNKGKDATKRGTIRQAHLLRTQTRQALIYSHTVRMQFTSKSYNRIKQCLFTCTKTVLLIGTWRHNIHTKPRKENGDFPFGRRVLLPQPSAWSRLAPTPLVVCELSPALHAQRRRSATPPALPRLPSVPPWTGRPPNRERRTKTRGTQGKDSDSRRLV